MTYQVIQYGEQEPAKVGGDLSFEKAKKLKERCEINEDRPGTSYEIHEEEAR